MNPPYKRVALGFVVALGMLGIMPGVAFAANPTCGTTIMVSTTLHADMDCTASGTDGIIFGKKGLTLDLNGHTIFGPTGSDTYSGVDTNEKKHVTVKNGAISDFQEDLYADESVGGTFKKLHLTCDGDDYFPDGAYFSYGANNTINKIHTDGPCWIGLDMYGVVHNWITNSRFIEGYYGVYTEYDAFDHFVNNYAEATGEGFYEDYGGNQTWTDNEANGVNGSDDGFYFDCSDYGALFLNGNEAYGNDDYGFYTYYCYDYTYPSNNPSVFTNNSAHDNSGDGAYGFYDEYSYWARWTNNTAKDNQEYGFYLESPGQQTFNWNVANGNGSDGIYADGYSTSYNFASFANNTANNNDSYGIDGGYGIANASGNTAHGNGNAPDDCYNVECNQ